AMQDPRVKRVVDDGRHYLTVTRQRFHVVISEPSNPWLSGPARLFTRQFFQQVRNHLTTDGVYVQWIPLYGLSNELLKTEVRTFLSVFPHVAMLQVSAGDLVLVGGGQALVPHDVPLPHAVEKDMARIGSDRDRLLARFVAGTEGLKHWAGAGALNTDNNGLLEFGAPRFLLEPTLQVNQESVQRIPWRAGLTQWGKYLPLALARAYLGRRDVERAAYLANHARAGSARQTLEGDIAARKGYWVTAANWWRRAGEVVSAQLSLTELAFSDGQAQRAMQDLADIAPDARTPYFHYLAMLVALQRGDINAASAEAAHLAPDGNPSAAWQVLAVYFKDLIARRLGHAQSTPNPAMFDHTLDRLRQRLEREQGEPVLDGLLRRLRSLPPGLLDAGAEQRLEQAMSTRLLHPLELYNRGVSLFFMGRFSEAEQVLQTYLQTLPTDSGPSYARVLIERAQLLRQPGRATSD
ncbi:MAG: hypothetical protein EPN40_03240, partial [Rhodanobacteraceae bacterium]